MKHPFYRLTLSDVEKLRKKRSCIPAEASKINYKFSLADIIGAQKHLQKLYIGEVRLTFAERILLLNEIY